ncbi:unnamed protein product, partial [Prorocentrum cordatum]
MGVAHRRAKSWLERCSLKVLEGEAWLQEARDAEDLAVTAAVEAKRSWEEACAKQLPQPAAAPPAAAGASSLNLSTLLGEDSEVEGLTIVDGPMFSTEGLDLDPADFREWERVKTNLAAGIKAEISKALGSSVEQLAALRAEAKQALRATAAALLQPVPLTGLKKFELLPGAPPRSPVTLPEQRSRDFSRPTYPGLPSTFYGDIFMSAAEELAFDPESYQANLYKVTLYDGRPAPQYGDMFLTEAEEVHFLPVSQPLSGILQLKDQDPQRICELAWRARRSQRARYLQMLRNLESEDHGSWQEELQRQAIACMEAQETLDTRAPQRRVQGGFQVVLPFLRASPPCSVARPRQSGGLRPCPRSDDWLRELFGKFAAFFVFGSCSYWQFCLGFRAQFGFGQYCEEYHLCFDCYEWVSGGVSRMLFQHGGDFHGCFDCSVLDS